MLLFAILNCRRGVRNGGMNPLPPSDDSYLEVGDCRLRSPSVDHESATELARGQGRETTREIVRGNGHFEPSRGEETVCVCLLVLQCIRPRPESPQSQSRRSGVAEVIARDFGHLMPKTAKF